MRFLTLLILVCSVFTFSQVSDKVSSVSTSDGKEGDSLAIQAELLQRVQITQVLLAYRPFGASEYKQIEMSITGNTASGTIPGAEVIPNDMEYYFILKIQGQETPETFPRENPETHPLHKEIRPRTSKEAMVIFLSPEVGSRVTADELFISISLVRASSAVNLSATKIYIDDRDVTSFAVITGDLITLLPENITPPLTEGSHTIKVELYDKEVQLYHSTGMSFTQVSLETAAVERANLKYNASLQLESRNETIVQTSTPYNRGNLSVSSQYGILRVNGRVYVTNEDKTDRQPQNRFLIEAQLPWLRVGFGDAYPVFPSLIMSGKRLRGLTSNLTLGFFNVDFARGEVVRKVDGDTLRTFLSDSLTAVQNDTARSPRTGAFAPYDSTRNLWAEYQYGTFSRSLTVIRPSFGSGENFQLGFTYLKSKDDVGSIQYGIKPQENVALGSDLLVAFDNRRFEFTAQGAASLYNKDIKPGNLTDAQVDSIYRFKSGDVDDSTKQAKKRQDLRDIRDRLSKFITVNQNLVPLSLDKISTILAYEAAAVLNYFDNYLKATYIFRGSEYNSFGQTFIRKDIKGFNLYDRLRLLENQLFFSGGYEGLEDNTDGSKTATTTFTNWNTTISYFPRIDFPNVTFGYGQYESKNGVPLDSIYSISDMTNRFFIQLGYDFTAGLRHNASLTLSISNRDDKTIRNADTKNTSISGTLITTWQIPLQTTVRITQNLNSLPSSDTTKGPKILSSFNYTTVFFGGNYRLLEDRLRLFASLGPTVGDLNRTMWDAGAEYMIVKNLSGLVQFSLFQNPGVSTDVVWSIMLRYDI